jgi:hypothetical protein
LHIKESLQLILYFTTDLHQNHCLQLQEIQLQKRRQNVIKDK